MKNKYDLCVIGGGISGLTATYYALEKNLKVALFEKNEFGGKAFNGGDYYLNDIFEKIKSNAHQINNLKLTKLLQQTKKEKANLLNHYFPFLNNHKNLTIFKSSATIVNPNLVTTNNINCYCDKIIIATGSRHNILQIDGLNEALNKSIVLYSTQLNNLKKDTKKVAILGGGRIALELAMMLTEFKIDTHIFARGEILKHLDNEVKEKFINAVSNDYFNIHTHTTVNKIKDHKLYFNNKSDTFDYIILASGFYFDNQIIKNLNLDYDKQGIVVNEFMQTSIKNIYAIGDANYNTKFSSVASSEALVAVDHIKGFRTPYKNRFFYRILGSWEYAYKGKGEQQLKEEKISYKKLILNKKDLPEHHDKIKFVKVLINSTTREILGIFVIAKEANTLMNSLLLLLDETIEDKINSRLPLFTNTYYIAKTINEKLKEMDINIINTYYQPFYQIKINKDKKIIGAESLARFKQSETFLFPLPFIQNFEKNGLIVTFDLEAIIHAANLINELKELNLFNQDFVVSVNLSSLTIDTVNYEMILNILDDHNINYNEILFEITERSTTEDKTFKQKLTKFRSLGLNLSIDDFSVGNSSLHLYYDTDFSEVKLDMALLPESKDDVLKIAIYKNLVNLMKRKDNLITSEGIETQFHFNFAKDLGVNAFQGYFIAKPIPKDELIKLLTETKPNKYIL